MSDFIAIPMKSGPDTGARIQKTSIDVLDWIPAFRLNLLAEAFAGMAL